MATGFSFIFKCIHLDSHCFSWGQTRPHTAGSALVSFSVLAASRNSPRSMFFMKRGMSMPTGQPSIHPGLAQSRQRLASVTACSAVNPWFTSSLRLCERYSASSSFISTRGIAVRSFGFIDLRKSCLQAALRLFSSISLVASHSGWSLCISSRSIFLNAPIRFSISSKST